MKLPKRLFTFRHLVIICALLVCFGAPALASPYTDITISAQTIPNFFNPSGLDATITGTASVTNGSATVTSSAAFKASWVNGYYAGFIIKLGSTNYYVASVESTSSLTLNANYAGSTGSVSFTVYPMLLLRFYADQYFTVSDGSYIVQQGTVGSSSFFRQYAVSVIGTTVYLPAITLPSTTDALNPGEQQAAYSAVFYKTDGSTEVKRYDCFNTFRLPPDNTTTTWAAICTYNSSVTNIPVSGTYLTASQTNALLSAICGTTCQTYSLGSRTAVSGQMFTLQVGSDTNKPAIRYNGTTGRWQYSDDGLSFTNLDFSSVFSLNGQVGAVTLRLQSSGSSPSVSAGSNFVNLNVPDADDTHTGWLTAAKYTVFNTKIGAVNVDTSGSDISASLAGMTVTLHFPTSSASVRGALSSTDWSTFNNKIGGSLTSGYLPIANAAHGVTDSMIGPRVTGTQTGYSLYNDSGARFDLVTRSGTGITAGGFFTIKGGSGPSAVPNAAVLGYYGFAGYEDSNANNIGTGATMRAVATETWANGAHGTDIIFSATPAGSETSVDVLQLTGSGYVRALTGLQAPQFHVYNVTRSLPTTVNDEVHIGQIAYGPSGTSMRVTVVSDPAAGFAIAKTYVIANKFSEGSSYYKVMPLSSSGADPIGGDDFDLDYKASSGIATLRLRRTAGSAAGDLLVNITYEGHTQEAYSFSFTPQSTTSSVSAPSSYLHSAIAGQTGSTFTVNGALAATSLAVGGGTALTKLLKGSASLDFGATAAGACDALTITVTGAADGDAVFLGIPAALAGSDSYQTFWGYVSSANTVTVKRCNPINATTALSNPSAATVTATVVHF